MNDDRPIDPHVRRAVERIDVNNLPPNVSPGLARLINATLNEWAEVYGLERPSRLEVCSDCQDACGRDCGCWCHGKGDETR